ncbi:MAG: hypothetical protein PHI47_06580 [Sulfuricurvum sp.]|uniref:hypothetical protein n=1 Tax=Sulfuricurvum sp. TaxID=2025608 RepID=UPI002603405E|nr:hypothetical protein [Sulfuricurvum sp.]MDD5159700.1 hypothetical protein [Sulfuricurvum sp.]
MVKYYKVTTGVENEIVKSVNHHRFNNGEIVNVEENVVRVEADEALIVEWVGVQNCDPVELTVSEEIAVVKAYEKTNGALYDGVLIPYTNDDAMGLLQVKALFEMGGISTNIHFSNGAILPIVVADFPKFAAWFVEKRNGLFI